jgi:DNA-binding MarR family transcriptional regulator
VSLKGTSTPTEIARYTGLTTGSTTAMLDRLEKAHFISRKPNPKDRRGILIEINETYMQAVRPCISSLQKAHTNLFTRYSDKELKVIVDFLTRFADNVKESTEAIKRNS